MSEPTEKCQHGRPFYGNDTYCRECEIIWYLDCLADAERRVISCRAQIEKLQRAANSNNDYESTRVREAMEV